MIWSPVPPHNRSPAYCDLSLAAAPLHRYEIMIQSDRTISDLSDPEMYWNSSRQIPVRIPGPPPVYAVHPQGYPTGCAAKSDPPSLSVDESNRYPTFSLRACRVVRQEQTGQTGFHHSQEPNWESLFEALYNPPANSPHRLLSDSIFPLKIENLPDGLLASDYNPEFYFALFSLLIILCSITPSSF